MINNNFSIEIPQFQMKLTVGCIVKISRFDTVEWILLHGWYSWGGNRPVCGWYLKNRENPLDIKPLEKPDLDDIYLIER